MASWKKIIVSGSVSELKTVSASDGFSGSIEQAHQPNITSIGTLSSIDVDGGAVDGAVIGANDAAAGTFTTLTGTSLISPTIGMSGDTDLITLSSGNVTFQTGSNLKVDTILESTAAGGVTIDGVKLKDNNILGGATTLNIGPSNGTGNWSSN